MRRLAATVLAASVLVACLGPRPPDPSPTVVTVPAGVDATCATDVTADLQAVLDQAHSKTLRFTPGACYRAEQPLNILNADGMTIEGNGAVVRRTVSGPADGSARGWRTFFVQGGRNIVVRNVTVEGPHPDVRGSNVDYEAQHAYWLDGPVQGFWLLNSRVHGVWGDNVYMAGRPPAIPTNITIAGNQFDLNGRQGVACASCQHVLISENEFRRVGRSTVDLEPGTANGFIDDVSVVDNTVYDSIRFFAAQGADSPMSNIWVLRNTLIRTPMYLSMIAPNYLSVPPYHRHNVIFDRNTSTTLPTGGHVVWARGVENLRITNNTWRMRVGTCGDAADSWPGADELVNNDPQVVENNTIICG
jgi:hypothetical protein